MARKSAMDHRFSNVQMNTPQRSKFDRSHPLKTTLNAGLLVPIFCDEAVPGDTFSLRMNAFGRMATPIHPLMDNLFIETFFFSVPKRILHDNWVKLMGEQDNPGDSIDFLTPQVNITSVVEESIHNYLGLPISSTAMSVNAFWHRAYNSIFNYWFRSQDLQSSQTVRTDDGPDADTLYRVFRRGKRHDYFTSCMPAPQKGPAVPLPLGQQAPIWFDNITNGGAGDITAIAQSNQLATDLSTSGAKLQVGQTDAAGIALYADLTSATASTINELRQASQIQRMQERDARGGTRYPELVLSHFGVISPDARQQRPEYIGGGRSMININPVPQTSETATGSQTPQGNLAAYGTMSMKGHGFTHSFTEHSVVLGIVNIRADLTYQQGINKMFLRRSRYDYYFPDLANLGEQAVLSKEIYYDGTSADDNVFGYNERWSEMRYKPGLITGKFASKAQNTLDPWHLSQNFATRPGLNSAFIEDNPPIERVIAVQNEPQFLLDCWFDYKCARPMPVYSTPGIARF